MLLRSAMMKGPRTMCRSCSSSSTTTINAIPEPPESVAKRIGAPTFKRHIFLCSDQTKPKCCSKEVGLESWNYLKKRLKELQRGNAITIGRTKANCLQICNSGPIAVVFDSAGSTWYKEASPVVLEEIIQQHLLGGVPVSRYVICQNDGR